MLRPLPRVVAPFRDETITSYLHRLAGPNHIDPAGLRSWLAGSDRKDAPVPLGRLAAVTGMPCRSLACAMPQICTAAELSGLHVQPAPRPRRVVVRRLPALRRRPAGHPVGAARRCHLLPAPPLDQQRPRAARPDQPARDPARTPAAPAADPPPRPGPGDARGPRRPAHLHRLAPGRAARPRLRPPHGDLLRPRLGRPRRMGAPGLRRRHLPAVRRPGPAARQPLLARAHPRQALGRARRIHRRTTPHRRPRLHLGLPPAPAGAAAGTTRCSNGDCIPAASSSSRSRPAMPGTCPKPSSRPPRTPSPPGTPKAPRDSDRRDNPVRQTVPST